VSREAAPVSVSAANYSQLSDERLHDEIHAPIAVGSNAPALRQAAQAHRCPPVPGEVYPNDVPPGTVILHRPGEIP